MRFEPLLTKRVKILGVVFLVLLIAYFSMGAYWAQSVGFLPGGAYVVASDAPSTDKNMARVFGGMYGARCAVCDGTADNVQIQAAITALGTGDTLVSSAGTFSISSTIIVDYTRFTIRSVGLATIWKAATNLNNAIISSDSTDGLRYQITIKDMFFDGNKANQSSIGYGVNMTGWNDVRILNNKFWNFKTDAIYANGSDNATKIIHIKDNTITASDDDGIQLTACYAFFIDGNYIGQCGGNNIELASGGEGSITNNIIDEATSRGIYIYATDRLLISNNPYIGDNGGAGIDIDSSAYDILIQGNMILENGSGGTIPYGIRVGASTRRVSILDNWINDNSSGDQDYGIALVSGANLTMIHDNNLLGNNVAAILDSGAVNKSIKNNPGWVTENSGTATILNGTTVIAVTHGLAVTPAEEKIRLVPLEDPSNTPGAIGVSNNATATTFWIFCENDPGASNLDIGWSYAE